MKKLERGAKFAITTVSLVLLCLPLLVAAQLNVEPPEGLVQGNEQDLLKTVTNWVLGIAGGVAVLVLIIGGFMYVTSAGNETMVERAKKTMMYAIIGIVVILLAFVILQAVQRLVGATQ